MNAALREIYNFLQISARLATAGLPTENQLVLRQAAGDEVVINLAMSNQPNALTHEAEIVEGLEMGYISIPLFSTTLRTTT